MTEIKGNVKVVKSLNTFGFSNFIGETCYIDPKQEITISQRDEMDEVVEGKFKKVAALDYFIENNLVKKI